MAVPKLVTPDGERLAAYRKDPNLLDMLCRIWFRSVFPEKWPFTSCRMKITLSRLKSHLHREVFWSANRLIQTIKRV